MAAATLSPQALRRTLCSSCLRLIQIQNQHNTSPRIRTHSPRPYHTSPLLSLSNAPTEEPQALPLGSFYEDLLSTPLPSSSSAPQSQPPPPPQPSSQHTPKIFYGAERTYRNTTPSAPSTWRTINRIPIPPRPSEPDNCCMSGCLHCVWDDYRDEVEGWALRLREAQARAHHGPGATRADPKQQLHRPEVASASGSMDDDGGGSEGLWTSAAPAPGEDLFEGIPVGIREFMATEKRLRERKKRRKREGR